MNRNSSLAQFGQLLRQIRRSRRLTQEEFAGILGVTKFQISHIEAGRRDTSAEQFDKLVTGLEPRPTLKEMEKLQFLFQKKEERKTIESRDVPSSSKGGKRSVASKDHVIMPGGFTPALAVQNESVYLKHFKVVHIVAVLPIELTEFNGDNEIIKALVDDIKARNAHYIYWTVADVLPRFRTFFDYLEKARNLTKKSIEQSFEIITAPKELSLLSFAIYAEPLRADEYKQVGRILIRSGNDPNSFQVIQMGLSDRDRIYAFLKEKYEELKVYYNKGTGCSEDRNGYKLLSAKRVREG